MSRCAGEGRIPDQMLNRGVVFGKQPVRSCVVDYWKVKRQGEESLRNVTASTSVSPDHASPQLVLKYLHST